MVSGLLVALVLAALQVCWAGLYRTIVTDAVASASAYAALADVPDSAGVVRAHDLIRSSLGPGVADSAVITQNSDDPATIAVHARVALPILGTWGIPGALTVTGRAVREVMP